jgi:ribosomal-protein-serine acetyltransferase
MVVRIRPYTVADAQAVWDAAVESSAELLPWMAWFHTGYHLRESRSWLEMQVAAFRMGTSYEFAIESDDGRYLGGCGINQIDPLNRRANLGYWVRTSESRRGVATAAAKLAIAWAFKHTDFVRIEIVAATANIASQRVAERTGAQREGVLRSRLFVRGQFQDAVIYSLIKE